MSLLAYTKECEDEVEKLKSRITKLQNQFSAEKKRSQKLAEETQKYQRVKAEFERKLASAANDKDDSNAQLVEKQSEIEWLQTLFHSLEDSLAKYLEAVTKELKKVRNEIQDAIDKVIINNTKFSSLMVKLW